MKRELSDTQSSTQPSTPAPKRRSETHDILSTPIQPDVLCTPVKPETGRFEPLRHKFKALSQLSTADAGLVISTVGRVFSVDPAFDGISSKSQIEFRMRWAVVSETEDVALRVFAWRNEVHHLDLNPGDTVEMIGISVTLSMDQKTVNLEVLPTTEIIQSTRVISDLYSPPPVTLDECVNAVERPLAVSPSHMYLLEVTLDSMNSLCNFPAVSLRET